MEDIWFTLKSNLTIGMQQINAYNHAYHRGTCGQIKGRSVLYNEC